MPSDQEYLADLASHGREIRRVILHVHRNASTGVWSLMRHLAREQNRMPGVLAILGIPADREWLAGEYRLELRESRAPHLIARVPKVFGTGAFLWSIVTNPVRGWIEQLLRSFPKAEIVLHSHSAWLTGGYLPIARVERVRVVATFHGVADEHRLKAVWWLSRAHRFLARRLLRSEAILTAVSSETAAKAERLLGLPEEAFAIVPNGLPCRVLSREPAQARTGGLVIGHVGQMHQGKGWRLLLEAVDVLRSRGQAVRLVLAGSGKDAELARQAAATRPEYVQYLGAVPNAGETLIPSLDVLVLATWSEGLPMSVIEAFAAGVPVVATEVGGLPEMLRDGENGFFIARTVDSIVEVVSRFLRDPELCARLGRGALATFKEQYEISRVLEGYAALYESAQSAVPANRL